MLVNTDSDSDDSTSAIYHKTLNGFIVEDDINNSNSSNSELFSTKERLYCICRSNNDIERFMIMCEKCEEWFHGECINLSEEQASFIKHFFCSGCLKKYSYLQIVYHDNAANGNVESGVLFHDVHNNNQRKNHQWVTNHKDKSIPIIQASNTIGCDKCGVPVSSDIKPIYVGKNVQVQVKYKGEVKMYNSKIIQIRQNKRKCYKIHYIGYNQRHDTWISAKQIYFRQDQLRRRCNCSTSESHQT